MRAGRLIYFEDIPPPGAEKVPEVRRRDRQRWPASPPLSFRRRPLLAPGRHGRDLPRTTRTSQCRAPAAPTGIGAFLLQKPTAVTPICFRTAAAPNKELCIASKRVVLAAAEPDEIILRPLSL